MVEENKDDDQKKIELTQIQQMVNNCKTEIDYMKKVFTVQKLKKIDESDNKIRSLEYALKVFEMNMENCALKSELEETN